jgi:hypothetical protein
MEVAQAGHHLFRGTYLAYLSGMRVSPLIFLMSPWDGTVRKAARNWLRDMWQHPGRLLDGVQVQTIGIIQAPDVQPGGRADMCDSCPDMTIWEGRLINSCRMDEYRMFGDLLSVAENPKTEAKLQLARGGDVETAEAEQVATGRG